MVLKAIETRYAGCKFRSRLEARWAVFFDALGIEWEYEPEGFETEAGWYLPDFYLPALGDWIEIKGSLPSQHDLGEPVNGSMRDFLRPLRFSEALPEGQTLRLLVGQIPTEAWSIVWRGLYPGLDYRILTECEPGSGCVHALDRPCWLDYKQDDFLEYALNAARSARFEHGQSGAQ